MSAPLANDDWGGPTAAEARHDGFTPSAAQRTVQNGAIADELRLRLISPNCDIGPGPHDREELEAFACECVGEGCRERVRVSLRVFERLRAAGCCVIAPGHEVTSGESVVSRQEGFWVVRLSSSYEGLRPPKSGEGGLDPDAVTPRQIEEALTDI
jgi:hypothetical protein